MTHEKKCLESLKRQIKKTIDYLINQGFSNNESIELCRLTILPFKNDIENGNVMTSIKSLLDLQYK